MKLRVGIAAVLMMFSTVAFSGLPVFIKPDQIVTHVKTKLVYPANKQQLIDQSNKTGDLKDPDKTTFAQSLPEQMYTSADEVISALKLK